MSGPSSIAATLIVRNEARCLARCLTSVAPFVDRMVVIDTGSTDDTVAIARAAGAEVHHLPWPDDFAEARNHLLACADADWNLMLDAGRRIGLPVRVQGRTDQRDRAISCATLCVRVLAKTAARWSSIVLGDRPSSPATALLP